MRGGCAWLAPALIRGRARCETVGPRAEQAILILVIPRRTGGPYISELSLAMAPKTPLAPAVPSAGQAGPVRMAVVNDVLGYLASMRGKMPRDDLTRLVCDFYSDEIQCAAMITPAKANMPSERQSVLKDILRHHI